MSVDDRTTYHERKIKNAVGWFFVGCIAFMALEFLLIYLGILTFTRRDLDLPGTFPVLALAGIYLLWQMTASLFFKTSIPDSYRPASHDRHQHLHSLVGEITSRLDIPAPASIYITRGVDAAVFCRPNMLSLFVKPKYELVVGDLLLESVSDDELRAILYHEFGHYCSDSLGKKTPVYIISQYSKSFTAIKAVKKPGVWQNMVVSQIALFSYFIFWLCAVIDRHYRPLTQSEEYAADDVAAGNMGADILAKTLVKAALLQHYYRYMLWFMRKYDVSVPARSIRPLLLGLCRHNRAGVSAIPAPVRNRIGRVASGTRVAARMESESDAEAAADHELLRNMLRLYPAYEAMRVRQRSVRLDIHLDHRKHRLPLIDGRYKVLLDGKPIGDGNFIKGYDITARTSPGKHTVSFYAVSGITPIPCEFICKTGDTVRLDIDFRVHLRTGYYDIFVNSMQEDESRLNATAGA